VRPHTAPRFLEALVVAACLLLGARGANAQTWQEQQPGAAPVANVKPEALNGVDVVEHLGGALPRDAVFRDSDGKTVHLGDFFDGKRPTLLVFAYHTCPMLCSLVLDATVKSLDDVAWTVGDQFDVVSISIDPKDTPETAAKKRAQVVEGYGRAHGDPKGWHFLTGEENQIRKVTDAIGFEYRYDPRQKQYAHPAAIYLLTPNGTIARYLYGIQYDPTDVRIGLLEASQGRSVSTTERILLYCYHFDPKGGHYNLFALNVMRVGGGATLTLLGGLLGVLYVRDRRKQRRGAARSTVRVD
jgi:protein SCO1